MHIIDNSISELQKSLLHYKSGILLLVKLLNFNELNILNKNKCNIFTEFHKIIENICKKFHFKYEIILSSNLPQLYIILPNDVHNVRYVVDTINHSVQTHVGNQEDIYFHCVVGSMIFPNEGEISANKLVSLLSYGIKNTSIVDHYYSYEENNVNLKQIIKSHKNLHIIRRSLLNNDVKFAYQPIIERKTGSIAYYECLMRILNLDGKFISIGDFIQDIENYGLINLVDFLALEMVVKNLKANDKISLSVNISNNGLLSSSLLNKAISLLQEQQIANRLIIEITETALNQDFVKTKYFIDNLHKLGCRFAIDDFGSGFTSFKQLINLPIDIIKIDGSYIRDVASNNHSKFFIKALIKLAADLKVKTVAEFVENGTIAKYLISIEIDSMQGNFFLPASEDIME